MNMESKLNPPVGKHNFSRDVDGVIVVCAIKVTSMDKELSGLKCLAIINDFEKTTPEYKVFELPGRPDLREYFDDILITIRSEEGLENYYGICDVTTMAGSFDVDSNKLSIKETHNFNQLKFNNMLDFLKQQKKKLKKLKRKR